MKELVTLIEAQQKGHEDTDVFMIGEQLKEMAERDPIVAEILKKDLAISEMGMQAAAAQLKAYADKHRGKNKVFCISPKVAEQILRDFYGLPVAEEKQKTSTLPAADYIDLDSFL